MQDLFLCHAASLSEYLQRPCILIRANGDESSHHIGGCVGERGSKNYFD